MMNTIHPALIPKVLQYIDNRITSRMTIIIRRHDKKINALVLKQHNYDDINCKHVFNKRIANLTNIEFDKNELSILNKGLKYNLPYSNNNKNLIKEIVQAEAVIKTLPNLNSQNEMRVLINRKLHKSNETNEFHYQQNMKYRNEYKIVKQIRDKLNENNALILKADKSNTTVIINNNVYIHKVYEFINNNNITQVSTDPTTKFTRIINNAINKCT